MTVDGKENIQPNETLCNSSVAYQYGGNHKSGWLARLPDSWLPYVQLARLSPPAGLCLIYFPHIFGILHAAILRRSPLPQVLQASALMLGGSFFVSNAIHAWNDLIDAPLDALVERTRNRPIPRGAVSSSAALFFTATQAVGAALFIPSLPHAKHQNALYALPSMIGWTYYPWAKRHTNCPQLVLGFCLAWGIIMGSRAMGSEPFAVGILGSGEKPYMEYSTLCLFLASILWTTMYDTIYAHQDLKDDIKVGIKSLAVLYRERTKSLLWQLLTLMAALLLACGRLSEMDLMYHLVAVGGATLSLGLMVARVDLQSSTSCWWWFSNGFWFAGGSIAAGLLLEYTSLNLLQGPLQY
ncbi:MAG: hypothetical protein LQ338_005875 [Usnochroma carphineum]|nr:MAG: hypothetical protein LQ338_005875 [Usnochroma carphineum]